MVGIVITGDSAHPAKQTIPTTAIRQLVIRSISIPKPRTIGSVAVCQCNLQEKWTETSNRVKQQPCMASRPEAVGLRFKACRGGHLAGSGAANEFGRAFQSRTMNRSRGRSANRPADLPEHEACALRALASKYPARMAGLPSGLGLFFCKQFFNIGTRNRARHQTAIGKDQTRRTADTE